MDGRYVALNVRAQILLFAGDISGAASLVEEARAATDATGTDFQPDSPMALAAFQGHEAEASTLLEANANEALLRRDGNRLTGTSWARAVLNNGLGRYEEALAAAQQASESPYEAVQTNWALAELIEAAARSGKTAAATDAHRRLVEMAAATRSSWTLGLAARSRALLSEGEAEGFYSEAIERLGRTRIRVELARSHLLTANGCDESAADSTPESSYGTPTTYSHSSAWKRSPNVRGSNSKRPANTPASGPSKFEDRAAIDLLLVNGRRLLRLCER